MDVNLHVREQLAKRVGDLGRFLEQSMANHNALAGRLAEAKDALVNFDKALMEAAKAAEAPTEAQGIDAPVPAAALEQPVN